jgi:NAD(P)-dependent dehydrogenase (short-subunit alcohol dehydrogenase family)
MVSRPSDPRVVLVTGGTRGIGKAVVEGLAARGHTMFLGARDLDRGRAMAREIPGDVRAVVVDVTKRASIKAAYNFVEAQFGHLDGLVNNAGINVAWDTPPSRTRIVNMRAVFDTDVFGVVEVTTAFIPLVRASTTLAS